MPEKPESARDDNAPNGIIYPTISYTLPDGRIREILVDHDPSIYVIDKNVKDAVAQALTLGTNVNVRFTSASTGKLIYRWQVS